MKSITEIMELEKSISDMLADLTQQIKNTTSESNMDGVKTVAKNAVTVNVSSLNAGILCPYYYMQSAQAEIVERQLKTAKTASEFVEKMRNMIDTKKVKYKNEVYYLNSKTIEALNSYLANL